MKNHLHNYLNPLEIQNEYLINQQYYLYTNKKHSFLSIRNHQYQYLKREKLYHHYLQNNLSKEIMYKRTTQKNNKSKRNRNISQLRNRSDSPLHHDSQLRNRSGHDLRLNGSAGLSLRKITSHGLITIHQHGLIAIHFWNRIRMLEAKIRSLSPCLKRHQ